MRRNRHRNKPVNIPDNFSSTPVDSPTVTITSVNGRSQTPGSTVIVSASYACPDDSDVSWSNV